MIDWQPLYSTGVYLVLLIAIVGLLAVARWIAVSRKNRRLILMCLRGAIMAVLVVLLLNPLDRRETVLPPRPPSVALLIDCSQSMSLGVGTSRIEQVRQTIDQVSRGIKSDRPIRIDLYRFGEKLAKVPGVAELHANEESSLLADALERLPSRLTTDPPGAVILFSDGAVPESETLSTIVSAYRERKIPIHAMLPGHDQLQGDVGITRLVVPGRVASGDQATIRVEVESHGFAARRMVASVRPADRPQSTPLATLPITLSDGPTQFELVVTADPALGDLVLEIPVLDGEAVASNNQIPFRLARRSRSLRVLYMEGTAAQEYRWLQDALHEDPDIQCVSVLVNNQYASRPSLQRIDDHYRGFPSTREELFEFDVVICSDISHAAFTPEQIEWTVDLVAQRGGGFAMVGGHSSFGSGGWDRTPWEQLIGFDMTGRRDYLDQNFSIEVPADAQSHPIWDLLDDPQQNLAALHKMPAFSGTNLISRVKPAATLLGQTDRALSRVGVMPVFACETYGRGRSFAMATDTTYAWGRLFESQWGEGDNRYYRKFWRNVVRWLAENSQASQHRLVVRTDQVIYSADEPIQIVAEAYDEQLALTTDYRVTAQLVDQTTAESGLGEWKLGDWGAVTLDASSAQRQYTGSIPSQLSESGEDIATPMQSAVLVVQAWEGDKEVASELVELQLIHDSKEWLKPQARPDTLQGVVQAGVGRMLESPREMLELLSSLDASAGEVLVHQLPLWDHSLIWLTLVGALALEWTLRRRGNSVNGDNGFGRSRK